MRQCFKSSLLCLCVLAALLLALPAVAQDPDIPAGDDAWKTTDDGTTWIEIPGSKLDALCGTTGNANTPLFLKGSNIPGLGDADTIINRQDDAYFDGNGDAFVTVKATSLNFQSVSPISTNCGSMSFKLTLQDAIEDVMHIHKVDENGGWFTANIHVQVKFQASGASSGRFYLWFNLSDNGFEPWSFNPPPNPFDPDAAWFPGVTPSPFALAGGTTSSLSQIICRLEGLPGWHCYGPPPPPPPPCPGPLGLTASPIQRDANGVIIIGTRLPCHEPFPHEPIPHEPSPETLPEGPHTIPNQIPLPIGRS